MTSSSTKDKDVRANLKYCSTAPSSLIFVFHLLPRPIATSHYRRTPVGAGRAIPTRHIEGGSDLDGVTVELRPAGGALQRADKAAVSEREITRPVVFP